VKNRRLHKCIAPRGTALFCELMVILHRLTQPITCYGAILRMKPETVLVNFAKIVWISATDPQVRSG
jgi:hypothetical protein